MLSMTMRTLWRALISGKLGYAIPAEFSINP